jgi:hypothetical protein
VLYFLSINRFKIFFKNWIFAHLLNLILRIIENNISSSITKIILFLGYLGRYLRRRMAEQTLSTISNFQQNSLFSLNALDSLIEFLNRSLFLINEFIERTANGGSNVTLGPRILLQCPLEGDQAREWFIRLWNDKLVPYLRKAAIESI